MVGTRLSRYRILEQIGAGGMGVVYRAHDERLQRDVAIKVLSPGWLADEEARHRFRREALALSRLSHPGIAVIHDFDRHENTDFLVMEFIRGMTLDRRVADGALPADEVVSIAIQAAEALACAHELGVVHRDLKPANLLITPEGRVKVLDFGLARLLDPAALPGVSAMLTDARSTVGTLAYMAPEVLGGGTADARSDLYSLGVVMYEMTTGRRPFGGGTALALMYEVLNATPPAPRELNTDVPAALEAVMLRAMERDPERRFASAADLMRELRAISGPAGSTAGREASPAGAPRGGAARIESLAVLPLENLSGDPGQEYFADGLTEALIGDLARIGSLRVISRTSVMRFKGVRKSLPEIARELNVDGIVEGSVVRGGDRVRITAQLIDARADSHLWSEKYERPMSDILALQSDVAGAIAREVQAKLSPDAKVRLASPRRVDPEAFEAYLRGRYCWNRRTDDDLRRSMDFFREAIDKDPSYALAYSGLADVHNLMGFFYISPPADSFAVARAIALQALEIDSDCADAHNSLGYARLYHDWDWEGSERSFRTALEINPGSGIIHVWYANLLAARGRFGEALAVGKKARELDPLSVVANHVVGWILYLMRRHEESFELMRARLEVDRSWAYGFVWSAWPLQEMGRHAQALELLERMMTLSGGSPLARASLARGLALAGRPAEARTLLTELIEESSTQYVSPLLIALVHSALGEADPAFRWLDRACEDRSHWLVFLDVDACFDSLRADPRFAVLRERVGVTR